MMKKKLISLSLLLVAAALVTAGVLLEQPAAVFAKAVKICMECIGLG